MRPWMVTVAIAIVLWLLGAGFASSVVLATEDTCASMGAVADPANNPGLVSDCAALLAARDTLVGTATLDWAAETPIADWDGVTVNGTPLRVTRLILPRRQLSGEIPSELGNLTNLQRLYLNDNSGLSGPLPGSFTGLTSLTHLDLSGTGVCAPTDTSFQAWLESIATRLGVVNCREQTTGDPLIDRYDTNNNDTIEKSEVIAAINDYLFGEEDEAISKAEVIGLINLYLFGPSTPHNAPGAPGGLTAAGNGQTRIDLSWSAPPSDGGTAITGYRIEVSEDRSTWTDLVANTGNAATSYSHTGLTAGTTRHYQVSAINSAGMGPASNIATGNTDTSSGNQAPDLVVGAPSVDDSSPTTGASFTLSATVRNRGDGSSAATTLRYYRSTDSSITSSDTAVGTDSVSGLSASGTSDESIDQTAPSTAGTYYYGACVDSVTGESNTTNNCSSGVTVTVAVATAPDLVVGAPSVDDSSPTTGASFTLSATVRNQGSGSSAATTLRYYRSTDSSISSSDTAVGTDSVGGLSASGTSAESIPLIAPSSAGTYYYGACVDSVSGESDTTNNCSSGIAVTVSAAPDLVVGTPSVDDSSPTTGASFTLSATVRNRGSGSSAATTLRYYRSTDSSVSSSDTAVGTDSVGGLSASGTSAESIPLTAPSSAGTYYYGACVDSVTGESNTTNNCSSAVAVAVGTPPAPDLVVGAPSVDDSSPTTGASFTLSATVRNQGSGSSAATTLRYYRSTDSSITSSDTAVGTDSVSGLSASGTSDESIDQTAPSTAGTYYYGACVDSVTGESNTTNNCSSGVTVTVAVATAPDLVVGAPSVDDSSPTTGASFTLSATVRNQGSGSSAATTLRYYRSTDSSITSSDTAVGTDSVSGLSASGTSDESIDQTAPSTAGTYYYGACVDSVTGESDTTNNCSSGIAVTVSAAPDLVVGTPSVDDSSPTTGASFTLSATVSNRGDGSSAATTLRYYRSTDSSVSSSDTAVGTDSVGGLSASGTSAESIPLTAPSSAGTYYYGACVDSVTGESNTTNNCSSAVAVAVGTPPAPDLVVGAPSVDDSSPTTGASFTLSATVRNQGSGSSAATTLRYYRSTDSSITSSDTAVGTDSVSGLSASGTSDESTSTRYGGRSHDSVQRTTVGLGNQR